MGLENNNRAIFLSIGDGKITRRVQQPTQTSRQRTTKQGKVINEEIYDAISGVITDVKVSTHQEYGDFWNVYLQDGEETFCLQFNYSSSYAAAFLKTLPNVDLKEKVRIIPSLKMEGTKKKVTLFVNQHGKALKHAYTKDTPNGLPQLEKIKIGRQEKWSDAKMMEFLEKMVNETIVPQLKGAGQGKATNVPVPAEVEDEEIDDKDLPF